MNIPGVKSNFFQIDSSLRTGEDGVSFIELAISLPLIVVFVAGVIDFGIGMRSLSSISSASRAGARFAAKHSSPSPNNPIPFCGGEINNYSCSGNLIQVGSSSSITHAARDAACNYLKNDGLSDGFLVDVSIESSGVNLEQSISSPDPRSIRVTVKKDLGGDPDSKFCLVCAEKFLPGMKAKNIKSKADYILDGGCIS